jgi:hypothetical protein
MKTPVRFSFLRAPVLALLLLAAIPGASQALMEIDIVTPERAKELGIVFRVLPAGPDAVRIEIEFEKKGDLKLYSRADLDITGPDGKMLVSAPLKEDSIKDGKVILSLAADRASLDKMTVRVVNGDFDGRVGHDMLLKNFVDLTKVK